ncbi:UDP-glucuronosyl/UDP-glucosyltransferase [Macleaya cordata]|uniref:UDP-glucuronosyl/UDP-glucosyltransferase n=1 Tax=Macleaya cordata TaxID=56857 RepID=A0A200R2J5_MACCD|nr:UDP-glucuronosyl/UDP-glucosyltransferase [Macleaya cordata]
MAAKENNHHVVMFPWLAFGHILPFFELSKSLASKGIQISFVSTPRNIQRLPTLPPSLKNSINLVSIDLPLIDNLPSGSEATVDLKRLEQVQYLKKAYDELQTPFEMLLNQIKIKPDLIIFDFIACWIPEIAGKFSIPSAYFSVYSATTLAFIGPPSELKSSTHRSTPEEFTVVPNWIPFPSTVSFRLDEAAPLCQAMNFPDITGNSTGSRVLKTIEGCDFILVRSCKEFEGEYLNLLTDFYQKPVFPIGLLPPQCSVNRISGSTDEPRFDMFSWLDKQAPKSVVFVGFGSEYKMNIDQIHELAFGLELSELPFLWVLRKSEDIERSDLLPSGYEDRITDRGFMCLGWVSQMEILAHKAIGGCLFHSGWGTIVESLSYGHAQILMPMMADQGLNARLLVEKGSGFEVERNKDGSFSRDAVAESMRMVMTDPDGEQLRLNAAQMREIFSNQDLHEDYINKFVSALEHPLLSTETGKEDQIDMIRNLVH